MSRDAKEGFGLGDRERDFLENLSLSDPKRERVGVVGDMVMDLRLCGCGLEKEERELARSCRIAEINGGVMFV
jgi:hypothetical protein